MAALTANANASTVGNIKIAPFSVNVADTYYRGSIVFIDATAGGVQIVPASGDVAVGVSVKEQTFAAAGEIAEVMVEGLVWLPVGSAITAIDEGDLCALDISATQSDNPADFEAVADITLGALDICLGKIMRVTASQMLIELGSGTTGSLYNVTAGTFTYTVT